MFRFLFFLDEKEEMGNVFMGIVFVGEGVQVLGLEVYIVLFYIDVFVVFRFCFVGIGLKIWEVLLL